MKIKFILLAFLIVVLSFTAAETRNVIVAFPGSGIPGDVTAPTFDSATINADAAAVTLSEDVVITGLDDGDFVMTGSTTGAQNLTGCTEDAGVISCTAAAEFVNGETVTVAYSGGADEVEDLAGNDLDTFSGESVTNNTPSGDTYEDIIAFFTFENCGGSPCQTNYTLSADDYPSSGTLTRNSEAEINSAAAAVGSYGVDATTGNDYYGTTIVPDSTAGVIAGWFYSYRASFTNYDQVFYLSDGGTSFAVLAFYSDDTVRFMWDDGTANSWTDTTPPFNITANAWYFFQITYDADTDYMKIEIAAAADESMTIWIESSATAFAPVTWTSMGIGATVAGADMYIDNFMVSDDTTRDFFPLRNETTSPR